MSSSLHSLAPLHSWPARSNSPLLISGPCSVESEEQYIQTAIQLAKTSRIDFLRGGIVAYIKILKPIRDTRSERTGKFTLKGKYKTQYNPDIMDSIETKTKARYKQQPAK